MIHGCHRAWVPHHFRHLPCWRAGPSWVWSTLRMLLARPRPSHYVQDRDRPRTGGIFEQQCSLLMMKPPAWRIETSYLTEVIVWDAPNWSATGLKRINMMNTSICYGPLPTIYVCENTSFNSSLHTTLTSLSWIWWDNS